MTEHGLKKVYLVTLGSRLVNYSSPGVVLVKKGAMPSERYNIRVGILFAVLLDTFTLGSSYRIVLYLANVASDSSNVELQKSLRSLHAVFLSQHQPYPVFIAYDKKDRGHLTPQLKTLLAEQINATPTDFNDPRCLQGATISFLPIASFQQIPWPFSMYGDIYQEKNPYYARLGYRLMCRFWAHTVFNQSFMRNVTSYLRLDTDTYLVDMPVDPFNILEDEGIAYLSSIVYHESPLQV